MSVEEFWTGDPDLFWAYRFSYHNKVKSQQELSNINLWLQGMYFYEAISVALNNMFSKSKLTYSNKPYDFSNVKDSKEKVNNPLEIKLKARATEIRAMIRGKKDGTRK